MEKKAIARINVFLSTYDKTFDNLTKNQREKFLLIDSAIQNRLEKITEAKEIIKENAINTMNISKDTGILRPALYQQPLFDAYIKSYKSEESSTAKLTVQNTVNNNKQLDSQPELVMKNDIYWASKLAGAESKYDNLAENVSNALDILKYIRQDASKNLLETKIKQAINALERDISIEPDKLGSAAEKFRE